MNGAIIAIVILFVLIIISASVYFFWWKPKKDAEDQEAADKEAAAKKAAAAPATASGATGAASGSYIYPMNINTLANYKQYDCPGAPNVLNSGSWCVFPSETDAQKYCNVTSNCVGYLHLHKNGTSFQVVANDSSFTTGGNNDWDWFPRTAGTSGSGPGTTAEMRTAISLLLYGEGGTALKPTGDGLKNQMYFLNWAVERPSGTYNPKIKYEFTDKYYVYIDDVKTVVYNASDAYKKVLDAINSKNSLTGSAAFTS